jgi:hypothetical protein
MGVLGHTGLDTQLRGMVHLPSWRSSSVLDRSKQPDEEDRHKSDQRGEYEQREIYAREEHEGCHLAPTGSDAARELPDSTSATDGDRLIQSRDRDPETSERRLETTILGGPAHQQNLIGVETAKGILDGENGIDKESTMTGLPTSIGSRPRRRTGNWFAPGSTESSRQPSRGTAARRAARFPFV